MKEAQKGYIRVAVLILVNKKPSHGYEIMKEIKERTKGFWKPTAGGVYPVLGSLEKSGYIEGDWTTKRNRQIKTYCITESGKQILTRTLVKQDEFTANMNMLFQEFSRDVLDVKGANFPFHAMPSPFSVFLEEAAPNKEETREELKKKREHLKNMIDSLNEALEHVDKALEKKQK